MAQYRIGSECYQQGSQDLDAGLARAYASKSRPQCLCHGEPGLPMYIAFVNGRYWLKRMPKTGRVHATGCPSWEMPEVFSGLKDLEKTGFTYEEDRVKLKLDFALSRRGAAGAPPAATSEEDKATVKGEGRRFTLRSLVHYLWDEAGLTQWDSSSRKRNWAYVSDVLLEAASNKTVKQNGLLDFLYIPPAWTREKAQELESSRLARFAAAENGDPKGSHKLLLLIGDLKEIRTDGQEPVAVITHVPTVTFLMDQKLDDRLRRLFGKELNLFKSCGTRVRHCILAATFYVATGGAPVIDEACLMLTTEDWIPIESAYEGNLIDDLVQDHRSFLRVLRYNRPRKAIMPTVLLTDHDDEPIAMYVAGSPAPPTTEVEKAAKEASTEAWIWDLSPEEPKRPPFPTVQKTSSASAAPGSQRGTASYWKDLPPEGSTGPVEGSRPTPLNKSR